MFSNLPIIDENKMTYESKSQGKSEEKSDEEIFLNESDDECANINSRIVFFAVYLNTLKTTL